MNVIDKKQPSPRLKQEYDNVKQYPSRGGKGHGAVPPGGETGLSIIGNDSRGSAAIMMLV